MNTSGDEQGARGLRRPRASGDLRRMAIVFAVAFSVRLAHVAALSSSPYFPRPVLDEWSYWQSAQAIAGGLGHPDRVFFQPPGYPYFLGIVLWIFGRGFVAPRLVQALLGAGTATLVSAASTRLFGPRAGLVAGLAAAFYAPLFFFDGEILATSLGLFLQALFTWALLALPTAGAGSWAGLTLGACGGAMAVVNASTLPLLALPVLRERRRGLVVVIGAALVIAPVTARNRVVGGEWVLISSNGGVNFWIGNNARSDATVAMRPGRDWQALLRAPGLAGIDTEAGASRYFFRRAVRWARREPAAFVALQARKLAQFVAAHEALRNREIYAVRSESPPLRLLLWKTPVLCVPWGLLLPLGASGLVLSGRRGLAVAAVAAVMTAVTIAFFVTARYRVTVVPPLLVLASAWAAPIPGTVSRRRVGWAAALAAGLFVASNLGQGPMPDRPNPDARLALAVHLFREGNVGEAIDGYRALLAEYPDDVDAWYQLAGALRLRGDSSGEKEALARAAAVCPTHLDTFLWHGYRLLAAGNGRAAEERFRAALAIDPGNEVALRGLAAASGAFR